MNEQQGSGLSLDFSCFFLLLDIFLVEPLVFAGQTSNLNLCLIQDVVFLRRSRRCVLLGPPPC